MEVTLKERWDSVDRDMMEIALNENEYVVLESWVYENGVRYVGAVPHRPHNYEVLDAKTNEPIRDMTPEESDAVFDFADEQFETEEELDNAYTEMER